VQSKTIPRAGLSSVYYGETIRAAMASIIGTLSMYGS
jgi:hypothetical protein